MNFFGHVVVARAVSDDPRFLLGTMLPDFVGMAGLKLGEIDDDLVARGVAHHHATDAAFHGAPTFLALMHQAQDELEAQGLSWGSALAVGHVGSELFLDGWLSTHHDIAPYLRALSLPESKLKIAFRDGHSSRGRLQALLHRLSTSSIPAAYSEGAFVAERLIWILRARPRLTLDAAGEARVAAWARRSAHLACEAGPTLMREVEERMASDLGAS